jgi:hypothetical protein
MIDLSRSTRMGLRVQCPTLEFPRAKSNAGARCKRAYKLPRTFLPRKNDRRIRVRPFH